MQTNFSVYTRDPIPTESRPVSSRKAKTTRNFDETPLSKKIRRDLHSHDPEAQKQERLSRISQAQRKKIARDQVLSTLINQSLIDQKKIIENLVEYAVQNEGLTEQRARAVYESALITTESNPSKSVFKIRIKI